jgi:hypothetical protein
MTLPRLVVCHCALDGKSAYAVCELCEARQLEAVLERRGVVAREHPSTAAWDALVDAYRADAFDREMDRAGDYMAEREAESA